MRLISQHWGQSSGTRVMLGYSDPNFSLGPNHDLGAYSSLAQVGRKGAEFWGSLGYSPLAAPSCPQLWEAALRQHGSAVQWPASRLLPQPQMVKSPPFPGTHQCGCSFRWTTVRSAALASCTRRDCRSHTSTSTSSGTKPLFFPLRTRMKPSCSSSEVTQIWVPGERKLKVQSAGTCGDLQHKLLLTEGAGTPSWERRQAQRQGVGGGYVRKRSIKHYVQTWVWKRA